jgi:hypothetical protein
LRRAGSFIPQPDYRAIEPGKGVKGVWVGPVPELVAGDLKTSSGISDVEPINIPGYWIDRKGCDIKAGSEAAPGEKVFLHFHGGAYVLLSAHPNQPTTEIVYGLLKHNSVVKRFVYLLLCSPYIHTDNSITEHSLLNIASPKALLIQPRTPSRRHYLMHWQVTTIWSTSSSSPRRISYCTAILQERILRLR